jgi:6-phosphofructokinase 1
VVVVAEGAEEGLIEEERKMMMEKLGVTEVRKDESGNTKNIDISKFMVTDLAQYSKEKHGVSLTIKYLNPTYAIRTTSANAADTDLCHRLSHVAVHCVQSGYTDFSVGLVRNYPVMIPIDILIKQSTRMLKRKDHEWQRLIQMTGQPNFLSKENMVKYLAKETEKDITRKENYIKVKLDVLGKTLEDEKNEDQLVGASGAMNY